MSEWKENIAWISRAGLRALNAGNSPTIHKNNCSKFDTPIYLGSHVDYKNSEEELAKAYQAGREAMRLEILESIH